MPKIIKKLQPKYLFYQDTVYCHSPGGAPVASLAEFALSDCSCSALSPIKFKGRAGGKHILTDFRQLPVNRRLCVDASHILLLILRKSQIILIANFSPRLPTLVIVYTIYFLLKPLHTVFTVLGKENINISCLMLNSGSSINTVLLIDACLSLDDHNLHVLYFFNVLCFYSFLSSFTFHCNSVRLTCWIERLLDLT